MKNSKTQRIRAVAWFVVLLALATSYYYNGYKGHATAVDSRVTDKVFQELDNYRKVEVDLSISNLASLIKVIDSQINTFGAEKIYSDEQGSIAQFVFQVNPQDVNAILGSFAQIGNITHKTETINTMSSQSGLESKLKDKETLYNKEFQDYNNSKSKFSFQLSRINQLSKEIDSLKFNLENQKTRSMTLLYVKAQVSLGSKGKIHDYKKFFVDFAKWFFLYVLVGLLVYYGVIVLNYILGLLGIKLPSLNPYKSGYNGNSGYSGYSGYGSKGYAGYSYGKNRKRRIKRIYRNKSGADDSNEEDNA